MQNIKLLKKILLSDGEKLFILKDEKNEITGFITQKI